MKPKIKLLKTGKLSLTPVEVGTETKKILKMKNEPIISLKTQGTTTKCPPENVHFLLKMGG
jgi:hypothetical protein